MNHRFLVSTWFLLGVPMLVSCQDLAEPRSILKKAIAAHGGEKNISKPRMGVLKATCKGYGGEAKLEETFDLPKRWKRVSNGVFDGKTTTFFALMTEGKLWEWEDGEEPQEAKEQTATYNLSSVVTVLLDLTGEKITLSPLKKTKVNGRSAVGLRAKWDGGRADYYFDDTTELLVQSKFVWQREPGKEDQLKMEFGDYKEIDGVKFPHRLTKYIKGGMFKDYTLWEDFIVTEVRILDKLPEDVFALPKKK